MGKAAEPAITVVIDGAYPVGALRAEGELGFTVQIALHQVDTCFRQRGRFFGRFDTFRNNLAVASVLGANRKYLAPRAQQHEH